MNENKKREWVKNAAIIFLVVLLLLTFFSNTIMNYSLPEVAEQTVRDGTLSEQIRGSGTVEANQTYEVKMGETRTIASVEVKVGDTVEKGQTLMKLEDSESSELAAAEKTLRAAQKAYDEAMLSVGADYRSDELDIAKQEEDLSFLKEELSNISDYQEKYEKAKESVRKIENEIKNLEKETKKYDDMLSAIAAEDYSALSAADYEKIKKAKDNLDAAEKAKTKTEEKIKEYESDIASGGNENEIKSAKKAIEDMELSITQTEQSIDEEYAKKNPDMSVIATLKTTLEKNCLDLKHLEEDYNDALSRSATYSRNKQLLSAEKTTLGLNQTKYDNAKKAYDDTIAALKLDAKNKSGALQDKLDDANVRLADAKADETDAEKKAGITVDEQKTKIRDAENALEKAKIALSQKQQEDAVAAGKDALAVKELQAQLSDAEEIVKKLKENSIGAEITAPVGGKITSISFSAGEEAAKDSLAAAIEMSEKGYTLEITATVEQAKKIRVGDSAEIQYFYGDASATLLSISPDKTNPSKNRILKFSIKGDVSPGQNLQISMGSKGQRYECIVPNSAIRQDNNGKFVLVVSSKSSPLGNRYIAERVDVEVLASDDTSSAISGDIFRGDYVITTSAKPIEAGAQVRLDEG